MLINLHKANHLNQSAMTQSDCCESWLKHTKGPTQEAWRQGGSVYIEGERGGVNQTGNQVEMDGSCVKHKTDGNTEPNAKTQTYWQTLTRSFISPTFSSICMYCAGIFRFKILMMPASSHRMLKELLTALVRWPSRALSGVINNSLLQDPNIPQQGQIPFLARHQLFGSELSIFEDKCPTVAQCCYVITY